MAIADASNSVFAPSISSRTRLFQSAVFNGLYSWHEFLDCRSSQNATTYLAIFWRPEPHGVVLPFLTCYALPVRRLMAPQLFRKPRGFSPLLLSKRQKKTLDNVYCVSYSVHRTVGATQYDHRTQSLRESSPRASPRFPDPCCPRATSYRAVRLHAPQGSRRARDDHRRGYFVSPAAPPGIPRSAGQRMARRRQAQQALLSSISRRQSNAQATSRRMEKHRFFPERNYSEINLCMQSLTTSTRSFFPRYSSQFSC